MRMEKTKKWVPWNEGGVRKLRSSLTDWLDTLPRAIYTDERYFRLNIFEGEIYDDEYEWNYFKLVYANADGEEYEYLFAVESETMHNLIEKALCFVRDYEPMNRPELLRPRIKWQTITLE